MIGNAHARQSEIQYIEVSSEKHSKFCVIWYILCILLCFTRFRMFFTSVVFLSYPYRYCTVKILYSAVPVCKNTFKKKKKNTVNEVGISALFYTILHI
jgi:hypothetical protein